MLMLLLTNISGNILKMIFVSDLKGVCKADEWIELKKLAQTGVHTTSLNIASVKDLKGLKSTFRNIMSSAEINNIVEANKVNPGDLFVICLGPDPDVVGC